MTDPKVLLGVLSLVIGLISYAFYIRSILHGRTRPDAASWFIWSLLAGITFFAQASSGGGAGAWATAFTALVCLLISILAFARGHRGIKPIDWISFVLALVGVGFWIATENPLMAVIIVIGVGALGFVPTFAKVFRKPREETSTTFALNALKFAIAFFALGSVAPVTWLYPAAMVLMNSSLAATILLRQSIALD